MPGGAVMTGGGLGGNGTVHFFLCRFFEINAIRLSVLTERPSNPWPGILMASASHTLSLSLSQKP